MSIPQLQTNKCTTSQVLVLRSMLGGFEMKLQILSKDPRRVREHAYVLNFKGILSLSVVLFIILLKYFDFTVRK